MLDEKALLRAYILSSATVPEEWVGGMKEGLRNGETERGQKRLGDLYRALIRRGTFCSLGSLV